jgi:hypothetical protein
MANARAVLEIALDEAGLLAHTGGDPEKDILPIIRLAQEALKAGDGEIPDERVRDSGLHPAKLSRLGL